MGRQAGVCLGSMDLFDLVSNGYPWCGDESSGIMLVDHVPAGYTRDAGSVLGRSPKVRNGNPLQYSCLENPLDRGDWRATVRRAAKSWTRLSTHAHIFDLTHNDSSGGKESACNAGDPGSFPGSGRSAGGSIGYPLYYSGLENSTDCIVHRVGHD